jgi:hypothetical protein
MDKDRCKGKGKEERRTDLDHYVLLLLDPSISGTRIINRVCRRCLNINPRTKVKLKIKIRIRIRTSMAGM